MSRVGLILQIRSVGFWHTGVCGDELFVCFLFQCHGMMVV